MRAVASIMTALVATVAAPVHAAGQGKAPDFTSVDTRSKAERLAREGKLVMILLFPAELGGENVRENRVFVPPEAAAAQGLIIGTLVRFAREGPAARMDVEADYKGGSVVPSRIRMKAWREGKPGSLEPTIHVW